jgi:tryptophanyl-tRNA synthetase
VYFVQQSQIPERYELSMLLMMLADYQKVLRNPTLKSELSAQKNVTLGFIAYPVDQVADIHMISPSEYHHDTEILVPVGEDQVPHLEDARDLVQAFNRQYGKLFNPCQALVGPVGRLVGTDGNDKMSKSKGNSIELSDSPEVVRKKVMRMFTDPNRIRADMPGETVNNPLFIYLRAFDPDVQEVANLTERYQQGKVRDVEVKEYLASVLNAFLDPIRERRAQAEQVDIRQILEFGNNATRQIAQPLLAEVRERMHLTLPK